MMGAGSADAYLSNVHIFISGSSTFSDLLREHVVQNVCSGGSAINVYVDEIVTDPGNGNPDLSYPMLGHKYGWVVQCTAAAGTGIHLAGKTIAVYKTDQGGDYLGARGIAIEEPAHFFIDAHPSLCSLMRADQATGYGFAYYNLYACGTERYLSQVADIGVSDIEPEKFTGTLAWQTRQGYGDLGNVAVKAGPGLVYGTVVTLSFRNELQNGQVANGMLPATCTDGVNDADDRETAACMPGLPSAYVSSVTQGRVWRWTDQAIYGNTLNLPSAFAGFDNTLGTADDVAANSLTPYVHICRQFPGSGTHAQHMIHYHRTNCFSGTIGMPAGKVNPTGNLPVVFENSASNMSGCLRALDTGRGYASSYPAVPSGRGSFGLGYMATTELDAGEQWRFIKIDNHAPTLENAFNGDYDQIYFSSFQLRTADAPASAGQVSAGNGVIYETGPLRPNAADAGAIRDFFSTSLYSDGDTIAFVNEHYVHIWGRGGFLVNSITAPPVFNIDNPLIPWARQNADRSMDSCLPLTRTR